MAAIEPHFAARLGAHIGTTSEELARTFATRSSKHWEELGIALDLPQLLALR